MFDYVCFDEFFTDIMELDKLFGGIRVILVGHFKQTLPIVIKENQLTQVRACIEISDHIWNLFKDHQYSLTENMRVEIGESEEAIYKINDCMLF